jgi:hypothetical protein
MSYILKLDRLTYHDVHQAMLKECNLKNVRHKVVLNNAYPSVKFRYHLYKDYELFFPSEEELTEFKLRYL